MKPSNRRKIKLASDPALVASIWLPIVSIIAILLGLNWFVVSGLKVLRQATSMLEDTTLAVNLERMFIFNGICLVTATGLLCVFLLFYMLALQKRITGPIARIRQKLNDMLSGQKSPVLKLRDKDHFKEIVDLINQLESKIK